MKASDSTKPQTRLKIAVLCAAQKAQLGCSGERLKKEAAAEHREIFPRQVGEGVNFTKALRSALAEGHLRCLNGYFFLTILGRLYLKERSII